MTTQRSRPVYVSGECEVDLGRRELRVQREHVALGARAFEVLELLVLSAGALVTKDDLMDRVWPGAFVLDNTLQVHIAALRRALGHDRNLLKTESGRGYRLLGTWTVRGDNPADERAALSAIRPSDAARASNLPVATTALIGRQGSEEALRDLILRSRVVTLTGPGGIGKTTLATKMARNLRHDFTDNGWLVELVSLTNGGLVPTAVTGVLDLKLIGNSTSAEAVARAIGDANLLLVLDNCEHVIDAAAVLVEAIVRFCPRVSILATSREALRVEGEQVFQVPPLDVPEIGVDDPDHILGHSAAELLITRTKSFNSTFAPARDDFPMIAAICRALDGIPLALEFAAARAATLGLHQVAAALDDRFRLLTSGRRTALPRHQTLRATLDWSYELLPEAERRLLRYLGIFPAGFTLEAVIAVAGDTESSVALGISNLVSKSLVAADGLEDIRRWRLLETVRIYSLEKLVNSGEYNEIARRHARFYLAFFLPFAREDELQSAIDHLGTYRREVDNLRSALNWAFSPSGDEALGVELAAASADFWLAVSLIGEASEWAVKALAKIGTAAGTRREMILRCILGFALVYTQGMIPSARVALTRALEIARELSDFGYEQRAIFGLWLFSSRSMALREALNFARSLEEAASDRDNRIQALAAWLVGIPLTYMAQHVDASDRLQWAADHYPAERRFRDSIRIGGDVQASASSHNTVNLLSRGLLDAASRTAQSAVKEARATSQPTVLCVALAWAAGFTFLSLGELEIASVYGDELVKHAYKHGLRPFHDAGLCVQGSIAAKRGDPEAGINALNTGLAGMLETAYLLFYPFYRTHLAATLGSIGRVEEGLHEIDQTHQLALEMEYRWYIPEILRVKGELLLQRNSDDPRVIEDLFRQSMIQARTQQALYWELSTATSLAQLLQRQGRHAEASAELTPVYERFTEGFSALRVQDARNLLDQLALPPT